MTKELRWRSALFLILALAAPALADDAASDQPGLMSIDWGSAIWILISFTILLIILYKAAWKNVLASLKDREQKIRGDIRQAEEARAKAEAVLKEQAAKLAGADEQIRLLLVKAASDAEKIAAGIRAQAQTDAEAEREKTRKEIDSARRTAVRQVYEQTAELATSIASKIIARNLNAKDQQDLVNQTLGQVEALKNN